MKNYLINTIIELINSCNDLSLLDLIIRLLIKSE